ELVVDALANGVPPQVIALSDGGFAIATTTPDLGGGLHEVRTQVYDSAGEPVGALTVEAVAFIPTPQIVALEDGRFVVRAGTIAQVIESSGAVVSTVATGIGAGIAAVDGGFVSVAQQAGVGTAVVYDEDGNAV